MSNKTIESTISVRNLVEFILRSGDIDSTSTHIDPDAMQEGSRIHRKIQKSMPANYRAEVSLATDLMFEKNESTVLKLTVEGRADGIMTETDLSGDVTVTIDEIKSTYQGLQHMDGPAFIHEAQAKCYGAIYGVQNDLEEITIQLTYCNIETEEIKRFRQVYKTNALDEWFYGVAREYSKWIFWEDEWKEQRNLSIKDLRFPFPYREGQRKLVEDVYKTIGRGKKLFIEAPTGVGKTISTVFPAVWSMGTGKASKIFYLTAKTIARTVAENTFALLHEKGLKFRYVTITAKEKICVLDSPNCNPTDCPRAAGHYDRVNDCVFDLLTHEEIINRDLIFRYAEKWRVCPFEMCLDVTLWSDAVVCDYNYAFDPSASLKRFFGEERKNDFIFLIDEAHNLLERARDMYSAELVKERFLEVKRTAGKRSKRLEKGLEACNKALLAYKRECDEFQVWADAEELYLCLMRLCSAFEDFFDDYPGGFEGKDEAVALYFDIRSFLQVYDNLDEAYRIYTDYLPSGDFRIKLMCMEPAKQLKARMDNVTSSILFSATLLPMNYYKEQLGGASDDYAIYAPSPFSVENRLLMVGDDISTKYTRRTSEEYERIADYIENFINVKTGNYMIFFTSYKMMEDVLQVWDIDEGEIASSNEDALEEENVVKEKVNSIFNVSLRNFNKKVGFLVQKRDMRENEKEEFLNLFLENPRTTLVGFTVMGGAFSEGIDLTGERLCGAVVVGCGLPMVGYEKELFKNYFDEKSGNGFEYAYLYPGMNKVMQAAGRVIRTDTDRGAILLLDDRFAKRQYTDLFPREWFPYEIVRKDKMNMRLKEFFNEGQ